MRCVMQVIRRQPPGSSRRSHTLQVQGWRRHSILNRRIPYSPSLSSLSGRSYGSWIVFSASSSSSTCDHGWIEKSMYCTPCVHTSVMTVDKRCQRSRGVVTCCSGTSPSVSPWHGAAGRSTGRRLRPEM